MKIRALIPFTMRDASTGKLTSIAHGGIANVDDAVGTQLISDGLAEAYTLISPTGTKNITSNGVHDVTEFASANISVEATLGVAVSAVAGTETLFGKLVSDLQENIAIANNAITGTLKYVTGYTEFSGKVEEQSGNYLAIKVDAVAGATITVELINGTVGHPVTLDSDGMIVLKIADTTTQSIEVVATKGNVSETQSFAISDLVLAPEG